MQLQQKKPCCRLIRRRRRSSVCAAGIPTMTMTMSILLVIVGFWSPEFTATAAAAATKPSGFSRNQKIAPQPTTILSPIPNLASSWAASEIQSTTIAIPFLFGVEDDANHSHNELDSTSTTTDPTTTTLTAKTNAVVVIFKTTGASSSTVIHERGVHARWSSSTRSSSSNTPPRRRQGFGGIPLAATDPRQPQQRWTLLGDSAVWCSMTGFAPDVDYLTRLLQHSAERHRVWYDSSSSCSHGGAALSTTPPLPLVHRFAKVLRDAGQWQGGGRPYGIQALIIGLDRSSRSSSSSSSRGGSSQHNKDATSSFSNNASNDLQLYTLDPSGGFRHWAGQRGTAIGRHAASIRTFLSHHSPRTNSTNTPQQRDEDCFLSSRNASQAIRRGLQACLQQEHASSTTTSNDGYDGWILWPDETSGELCVVRIDSAFLDDVRTSIVQEFNDDDDNNNKSVETGEIAS